MDDTLKIVELNVGKLTNKENVEKSIEMIKGGCCDADVIVLTELKNGMQNIILDEFIKEDNFHFIGASKQNTNYIAIIASNTKIKKICFEDYNILEDYRILKWHQDAILATIHLEGGKKIRLMAVRFLTGSSKYKDKDKDRIDALENFMKMINENKPDVVIGDLNWNSQILNYNALNKYIYHNENPKYDDIKKEIKEGRGYHSLKKPEKHFCELMDDQRKEESKYDMWPKEDLVENSKNETILASYISCRNPKYTTRPDRLIYDRKVWQLEESHYWPKVLGEEEDEKKWSEDGEKESDDWGLDHAMLVCNLKINKEGR